MIRLLIAISLFVGGYAAGGMSGLYATLLFVGLLGVIFPYRAPAQTTELAEYEAQQRVYEKLDRSRRGSAYDPTRPGYDEHPLLLTNKYRRVK